MGRDRVSVVKFIGQLSECPWYVGRVSVEEFGRDPDVDGIAYFKIQRSDTALHVAVFKRVVSFFQLPGWAGALGPASTVG
jgi:hypothetical protein